MVSGFVPWDMMYWTSSLASYFACEIGYEDIRVRSSRLPVLNSY